MTDSTLAVREPARALAPLGGGSPLTRDQIDLLKRTVARGVTDDELQLFVHVANRSGLDPFAKQIHAVKRWDKKANREVMTIQTGIDGFRVVASRTSTHAGTDEAVFVEKDGKPTKATVTVYKLVGGVRCPFTATARWDEYVQTFKDGNPMGLWGKMPFTMLGKCAEALALRKAFPMDLSGVYAHEEMTQAGGPQTFDEPLPAVPDSSQTAAPSSDRNGRDDVPVGSVVDAPVGRKALVEMIRRLVASTGGADIFALAVRNAKVEKANVKDMTDDELRAVNRALPDGWKIA